MEKDQIIAMLLKRIDIKGLIVEDVIDGLVKEKLDELADKTETPLDDTIVTFIVPELSKYVGGKLDEVLADYIA